MVNSLHLYTEANRGLTSYTLQHKQKHKKKSKALDLQQHQEYYGSAVCWSPCKLREAQAREAVQKLDEIEKKHQKA
jgi:hypothetical protein